MDTAYILLGSNLGNKEEMLKLAISKIESEIGSVTQKSSIYETAPWGFDCVETFYNQVVRITTKHDANRLLELLLLIEKQMGRVRKSNNYESRSIDLDILFYNTDIIENEALTIPHPRLHLRNFTLAPLNEIAPNFVHPVLKKTISELINNSKDDGKVDIIEKK